MIPFIRDESKYRCFWNFLHIKIVTQLLCILTFFGCIVSAGIIYRHGQYSSIEIFTIGNILVTVVAYIGILLGIERTKPKYFLPSLILTGLQLIVSGVAVFIYITFCTPKYGIKTENEKRAFDLLWWLLCLLYYICVFEIIFKCFKYVSDKAESIELSLPQLHCSYITPTAPPPPHSKAESINSNITQEDCRLS